MFGSEVLEIAIGIVFVYLLLSLICTAITELIAQVVAWRSKTLEEGIRNLLKDPANPANDLAAQLYNHPLVKGLAPKGKPAYIPSRTFALCLLDIVAPSDPTAGPQSFTNVRASIATLPEGTMRTALLALVDEATGDLRRARKNVENWFDGAMERVAGWYKRKTQTLILILAMVLTILLNVDTFVIAGSLWRDDALRASVAAAAGKFAEQPLDDNDELSSRIGNLQQQLQSLKVPIGWPLEQGTVQPDDRRWPDTFTEWIRKLLGLAFTVLAVSLGAPFWFDTLNRLITIRSAGNQPQ